MTTLKRFVPVLRVLKCAQNFQNAPPAFWAAAEEYEVGVPLYGSDGAAGNGAGEGVALRDPRRENSNAHKDCSVYERDKAQRQAKTEDFACAMPTRVEMIQNELYHVECN